MNRLAATSKSSSLVVLVAAFAGLVFAGVQLGLMPLASLSISRDILGTGYSEGVAGNWFARYTASLMVGAALGGITLGGLGDRIGRSKAMSVSVLIYSVAGGACALASNQPQVLLLRCVAGIGVGGMWPNGIALVAECWPNASRPMVAGVAGTGLNVGIFVVSQLGRINQVTADSWRWLFALSAVSLVLGVLAWFAIPESPLWLASRDGKKTASPARELFRPPLLRRTLIGIAIGAIPLIGAWGASKWMIPWADKAGGVAQPGLKAATQGWWAVGAILGSFFGSHLANLLGRRVTYFLISLGSVIATCGIFLRLTPLEPAFLPMVFVQGFVSTLFFGWLPLYLPELFPTQVRATGSGVAYNFGRFISAAGVLCAGMVMAWSGGDYARVGVITGLVYALGMVVIWWAPDTGGKPLEN